MSKKIGLIVAFLIVACLSFFITRELKDGNHNEETEVDYTHTESYDSSEEDESVVTANDIKVTEETPIVTRDTDKEDANKVVLRASKPDMAKDSTYSFTASFKGEVTDSYRYELWDLKHEQMVQSSNDGNFANIPPVEKGMYRLYLVNAETGKNIVPPITVSKFVPVMNSDSKTVPESDTKSDAEPTPEKVKKTVKFKPIRLQCKNNKYSFKASIVGELTEPYRYELLSGDKIIKSSDDGSFEEIPPVEGACYTLRLISEGEEVASTEVKGFKDNQKRLITKEEFQKRMLDSKDHTLDGTKGKTVVTKDFKVFVENPNKEIDGDFEVSDVQDVRTMISQGLWSSAQVDSLEYNVNGYVTKAKIKAKHNPNAARR